ncbi:hypothetical protein [Treponema endosymbiont of Eucomonympha sp.]|uniref:hypothetical protein n=1 Tax=Treponema endosymbiont of Eucomonympha sp. TaxID=1580831 RepID=UPI0007847E8E|nr:hypothetical protein [Treponema endosymbiont of Eucomonympha sp.]
MDNLLKNEFVDYYYDKHHALISKTLDDVRNNAKIEKKNTNDICFSTDDVCGCLALYPNKNAGTSRFTNGNGYNIVIINYDKFLTSLPNPVQRGKQRCDIIMYLVKQTDDFLLVEIKKSSNDSSKSTANKQLLDTLEMLITVPEIETFIKKFQIKRCCRFIKKISAPDLKLKNTALNYIDF